MPKLSDNELTPVLLAAAMKGVEKLADGVKLEPGTHPVDAKILIHVSGAIDKGVDSQIRASVTIPWERVLMVVLKRAKIGRDEARRMVAQALGIAFENASGANDDQSTRDRLLDVDTEVTEFKVHTVQDLAPKQRAGALRFMGTCSATVQK